MSPQTVHIVQVVTEQDRTNGFILANMIWPTQWVGNYNVQASFCYRSTNTPVPPTDHDSRRNTVVDAGVRDVVSTGYQHVLHMNPVSKPLAGDLIDFWGWGQQPPSLPTNLTVEVS